MCRRARLSSSVMSSSSSSSSTRAPRRVRFSRSVDVCSGGGKAVYRGTERRALWITDTEMEQMHASTKRSILAAKRGWIDSDSDTDDEEEHTVRGIEHRVCRATRDERRRRRDDVVNAVLAEQDEQRRLDENDPDRIAEISAYHSRWAVERSIEDGRSDAGEAAALLRKSCSSQDLRRSIDSASGGGGRKRRERMPRRSSFVCGSSNATFPALAGGDEHRLVTIAKRKTMSVSSMLRQAGGGEGILLVDFRR